ncbi:hypothetical protein [Natronoglomus mannanivorans]|uniref:Uncharacterized protein n=1 Tax=Natronoglomus mannanivorans TaxID=2979990 RepID=A0AAP2Z4S2_9EURY|nr:hypothetical protein [Halobacteria archaeon AArc-xg1-1]
MGRGIVGDELEALLETLDDRDAFERRLEELNDRARAGTGASRRDRTAGGETDV